MNRQTVRGAIVTKYGSQCAASKELGIPERRLSRLLNGHDQINEKEVRAFEQKLGVRLGEMETST